MEVDGIVSAPWGVDTVREIFELIDDHGCLERGGRCFIHDYDSAAFMYCSRPPMTEEEVRVWLKHGALGGAFTR